MSGERAYVVVIGAAGIVALAALLASRKAGAAELGTVHVLNDAGLLEEIEVFASKLPLPSIRPASADPTTPRGIRNNNPGNLVYLTSNAYNGQVGRDGAYGIYDTPENGIRAMTLELYNDYTRKNLRSISALITEWAPPSENDTTAYIRSVAAALNTNGEATLNLPAVIVPLVKAIIRHENGQQPYGDATIYRAISATGKFA